MQTEIRSSITGISSMPTEGIPPRVRPMVRGFWSSGSWPPPVWLYRALDRQTAGIRTLRHGSNALDNFMKLKGSPHRTEHERVSGIRWKLFLDSQTATFD